MQLNLPYQVIIPIKTHSGIAVHNNSVILREKNGKFCVNICLFNVCIIVLGMSCYNNRK